MMNAVSREKLLVTPPNVTDDWKFEDLDKVCN